MAQLKVGANQSNPSSVNVFLNGAWHYGKQLKVFFNGLWHDTISYVFNIITAGVEHVPLKGYKYVWENGIEGRCFHLGTTHGSTVILETTNTIDLTSYRSLEFRARKDKTSGGNAGVEVFDANGNRNLVLAMDVTSVKTYTLDVSSLVGQHRIRMYAISHSESGSSISAEFYTMKLY